MLVSKLLINVNVPLIVTAKLRVPLLTASKKLTGSSSQRGEEIKRAERKLKDWRNIPEVPQAEKPWWKLLERNEKKKKEYILIGTRLKLGPIDVKRWWKEQKTQFKKHEQRFVQDRHRTLGCELAVAHFLIHRGGKIKFFGEDQWSMRDNDGNYKLPEKYDPAYKITHLDTCGITLYYEGIENFQNLTTCTWANFSNNPHLNDWCIDRLVPNFPNIEYLDISQCKNVSERGLQAIYKLDHLKTLIITDFYKKPSFELTCAMLEECMPNLFIEIREPQNEVIEEKPE